MEAHELSFEAERRRGLKLEASKWRQALKDAEKRFERENGKAKSDGRLEAEAEFFKEREVLEENHRLTLVKEKVRIYYLPTY